MTYAIFAAICLFSIWRGGRWERLASVVLLCATILTPLIQARSGGMAPEARFFIVDGIILIFFLGLAVAVGRVWMIAAAAFQLLSTLCHPAAHFEYKIGPLAYLTVCELFSYGVFLSLGVGTLWGMRNEIKPAEPLAQNRLSIRET